MFVLMKGRVFARLTYVMDASPVCNSHGWLAVSLTGGRKWLLLLQIQTPYDQLSEH